MASRGRLVRNAASLGAVVALLACGRALDPTIGPPDGAGASSDGGADAPNGAVADGGAPADAGPTAACESTTFDIGNHPSTWTIDEPAGASVEVIPADGENGHVLMVSGSGARARIPRPSSCALVEIRFDLSDAGEGRVLELATEDATYVLEIDDGDLLLSGGGATPNRATLLDGKLTLRMGPASLTVTDGTETLLQLAPPSWPPTSLVLESSGRDVAFETITY